MFCKHLCPKQRSTTYICIRPLSSVQNKNRFNFPEPYDLSCLVKHVLLRFVGLLF